MKSLLRSTFIVNAKDDDATHLLRNFRILHESRLEFDVPDDVIIWTFIQEFVQTHNHVPEINAIVTHFTIKKEETVVNRVKALEVLPVLIDGNFKTRLEAKAEERRVRAVSELLKKAADILGKGIKVTDGKEEKVIQGPYAAIHHILDESHDIVAPTLGGRLSGEVTQDGEDFMAEYERVEADPLAGIGQHTGLTQMDSALNGAKRNELWIHAGFTGGLKSTFMLNWAYNQAILYNHSSLIFSLEMPYQQCRRILFAMHSQHPKFKEIRYKLGLQKHPNDSVGLPYTNVRDGTLDEFHPNAKKFLADFVKPDFMGKQMVHTLDSENNTPWPDPRNFGKIHIEVADPDKADFTMADLRHRAELVYSKSPFSSIYIDHVGLMAPRKWVSSTTERLNEIIRDCKRLAMSFQRGMGMAVIALFQINREGYKAATKRKEKTGTASYDLTHLSYANEAERCVRISSTYVTSLRGYINIGDISIGDSVWSSGGWKKVLNKFDNGVRRIWEVKTSRGSILEATAPHRVRVVQDGLLGWKAVRDLTSEDYLASSQGGSRWAQEDTRLPDLEAGRYETLVGRKGEGELDAPFSTTPTLAYLLGAWDGDGKVHSGGLAWTGNRLEMQVREAIRYAFQATFGHELPLLESPSRPGSFDLVKWSKPLKRWFEQVAGQRAGDVPECILQGTESTVCAYLRGLFDTDGWVNKNNIIGLKMKEASESFLRQIQMLLTGLGIDSHLSYNETSLKKTGKTYGGYTLRVVSREGRRRFLEKIGFTEDAKMGLVWDSLKQTPCDKQVYPVPETFLRVYKLIHPPGSPQTRFKRAFYNNPRKVKRTGLVPRGAIETLLQAATEDGIDNEDTRFLEKLLELQVMQVESVRDTGIDAPVMDLEVEGDHEYQTGPLLSHNSADIVTSSWVDDDLRDQNRVQFQCLKSRDQKPFEMFLSRVEWPCRRILTCYEVPMTTEQKESVGDALDEDDMKELEAR